MLSLLAEPTYGYDLAARLSARGLATEEGTLYPILRRLSGEELLAAEWDTSGSRPRKYYRTTDKGRTVLQRLVIGWSRVNGALRDVLEEALPPHVDPDHAVALGHVERQNIPRDSKTARKEV